MAKSYGPLADACALCASRFYRHTPFIECLSRLLFDLVLNYILRSRQCCAPRNHISRPQAETLKYLLPPARYLWLWACQPRIGWLYPNGGRAFISTSKPQLFCKRSPERAGKFCRCFRLNIRPPFRATQQPNLNIAVCVTSVNETTPGNGYD